MSTHKLAQRWLASAAVVTLEGRHHDRLRVEGQRHHRDDRQ